MIAFIFHGIAWFGIFFVIATLYKRFFEPTVKEVHFKIEKYRSRYYAVVNCMGSIRTHWECVDEDGRKHLYFNEEYGCDTETEAVDRAQKYTGFTENNEGKTYGPSRMCLLKMRFYKWLSKDC